MQQSGEKVHHFSSRWAMLAAMLGMAIGTGNIWRFPPTAAQNGGGSFLIAWAIFLLLWSIPLIMIEFALGKATRHGPVGAFSRLFGRRFAWMGAWVAWTATAIMIYYAVVMGWTVKYFWAALIGTIPTAEPGALWGAFAWSPNVLLVHAIAMALGVWVVARGVRGIETASKIMIPSLFVMLILLAIRAVTLPGAADGLNFLFTAEWSELTNYRVWLEALTQNAWSTGAGWGLITVYAIYMREDEGVGLNSFALGFGNNIAGLLAGIMVIATVFAVMPVATQEIMGAGNTGLTFIWVPQLFADMPGGRFFMILFFLTLLFAAWTSLISMIELATRVLTDGGMKRGYAIALVGGGGFLLGVPTALSEDVFANVNFIWGVALMVSGAFFATGVLTYGVDRFRREYINTPDADLRIGRWWNWAVRLIVAEAVVMIVWWFWQAGGIQKWLKTGDISAIFSTLGIGWAVVEWGVVLLIFLAANRWLAEKAHPAERRTTPETEARAGS